MRVSYGGKAIRFTNTNFEELQMLSSKLCALEVEFVEEKTHLKNLAVTKLYKFKIAIGCVLDADRYNERNSSKNTLKILTDSIRDLQDCKISELFNKTEKLHLQVGDMIGLEEAVSIHRYDERIFCNLRNLVVSNCVNLEYLFPVCVANGLRKLERLEVKSCSVLEALVHDYGREISSEGEMIKFEKLKFLSLQNLPKLASLFLVDNVVQLPQLVELEVDGLPNFTSIYPDCNDISALQQPVLNSQVRISVLNKLKVKSMEKLTHIWACSSEEEVNNISMAREIEVEGCDSLVNLFPTNPMRILNHLERLTVKKCGSIVVIFNYDLECVGHEVEQVGKSSLRSLMVRDSEKVRELWRIKGGENKSSSIHGFEALERINIEGCKEFRNVFTTTNTKELINSISSEEIPEALENTFNIAFPSSLTPPFPLQLSNLGFSKNEGVKVVFEISNGELETLFPYLKDLTLKDMERMTHVWKCQNWNEFLFLHKQHPQSSFHNLKTIKMWHCHRIQYLFSPLMARLFPNLEEIDVSFCEGIEEVVSNRDDRSEEKTTSTYTHTTTNSFPRLHSLNFIYLENLKHIGGVHDESKFCHVSGVSWALCEYSKVIKIESCEALSSVIPSYAVGRMNNLQMMEVNSCTSLTEVFETQVINHNNGGSNTNIDGVNGGNINVPQLSNLKKLVISDCEGLQFVFTFSTLESLKQLEELMIEDCNAMKVIVKEEHGEQTRVVIFPHLKSLELVNLRNLEGFFLGKNEFQWPSLEKVKIDYCQKMRVFTSGQSTAKKLEYMHTSLGKHSLECGLNFHVTTTDQDQNGLPSLESTSMSSTSLQPLPTWSFHNLIEIDMANYWYVKSIIPSNELLQLPKLERIQVKDCSRVKEVFEGTNIVVEIPNLRQLELENIPSLKYIWKSKHHWRTVLLFPNLTTLAIDGCDSLEHVFTSSMVGSLLRLQEVHVRDCENLKVIVKEEESEFEGDAKVKETVTLPCLKSLKLEYLKSLKGFYLGEGDFSWPSLHTLGINKCPEITVFTNGHLDTPALNIIDTTFGRCYVTEDLNSFIKNKKHEGYQF